MLRELTALSKMADEDKRKPSERVNKFMAGASQAAHGIGPLEATALATIPLAPVIRGITNSSKDFDPRHVPKNEEQLDKLVTRLVRGQAVNPDIRLRVAGKPTEAAYARSYPWAKKLEEELILAPKSTPTTIAHEIGHAIQPNRPERYLNILSALARTPAATALPSIMALSGGLSKDEEAPPWAKAAPYVGGAQLASILGEETRANVRALQLLKKKGIPTTALQKLRQFVPSLSYLGRGALLVGAPLGILKGMQLYEQSKKKGHPFTLKQLAAMSPERLSKIPTPEEMKKKWADRLGEKED